MKTDAILDVHDGAGFLKDRAACDGRPYARAVSVQKRLAQLSFES